MRGSLQKNIFNFSHYIPAFRKIGNHAANMYRLLQNVLLFDYSSIIDYCLLIFHSYIITIFSLQPIGVFMEKGCSYHLAINILLTLLGYIPGLIHACYIIVKYWQGRGTLQIKYLLRFVNAWLIPLSFHFQYCDVKQFWNICILKIKIIFPVGKITREWNINLNGSVAATYCNVLTVIFQVRFCNLAANENKVLKLAII